MSRSSFEADQDARRVSDHLTAVLEAHSKPAVRDTGADPEGVAQHPDELLGLHASLHILCKDTADLLVKHYPGFLWAVQPDQRGQIINILCLNFHDQFAYTIKVAHLDVDPQRREVIKAGSELLRRFRYPGTRFDLATANNVPRDAAGKAIPDLSDMPASRNKTNAEIALAYAEGRAQVLPGADGSSILQIREK